MKRYSMPSHMPDKFPFIDRKMWEKPKMDIVERLRQACVGKSEADYYIQNCEAADEIERLREALSKVDKALQVEAAEYVPAIRDAFDIISAALQQKDTE